MKNRAVRITADKRTDCDEPAAPKIDKSLSFLVDFTYSLFIIHYSLKKQLIFGSEEVIVKSE